MTLTCLRLKNMVFYGHHGVYDLEKEMGQRIEVDLDLKVDLEEAGLKDSLAATINYVEVYNVVKKIVEEEHYNLIEAIGMRIATQLLNEFSIPQVVVRIRKPQPPVGGVLDTVEFEVTKEA